MPSKSSRRKKAAHNRGRLTEKKRESSPIGVLAPELKNAPPQEYFQTALSECTSTGEVALYTYFNMAEIKVKQMPYVVNDVKKHVASYSTDVFGEIRSSASLLLKESSCGANVRAIFELGSGRGALALEFLLESKAEVIAYELSRWRCVIATLALFYVCRVHHPYFTCTVMPHDRAWRAKHGETITMISQFLEYLRDPRELSFHVYFDTPWRTRLSLWNGDCMGAMPLLPVIGDLVIVDVDLGLNAESHRKFTELFTHLRAGARLLTYNDVNLMLPLSDIIQPVRTIPVLCTWGTGRTELYYGLRLATPRSASNRNRD